MHVHSKFVALPLYTFHDAGVYLNVGTFDLVDNVEVVGDHLEVESLADQLFLLVLEGVGDVHLHHDTDELGACVVRKVVDSVIIEVLLI